MAHSQRLRPTPGPNLAEKAFKPVLVEEVWNEHAVVVDEPQAELTQPIRAQDDVVVRLL